MAYRVSKETFGRLVEQALAEVPEPFATYLQEIAIEVRDQPTSKQLRLAGVRRGGLLLGLYHGRPRTERSVLDDMTMPDSIYVFQDSIEHVSRSEDDLIQQVRTTVLHEIGHHFGMSEKDLDELGFG